jgi:hypothetical protein
MGFLLRWLAAFVLVAATYNPTQWNYVRWVRTHGAEQLPHRGSARAHPVRGLCDLPARDAAFDRRLRHPARDRRSRRTAVGACGIWGWLASTTPIFSLWIGIFAVSLVLGIGHELVLRPPRPLGQYDVDDADNE